MAPGLALGECMYMAGMLADSRGDQQTCSGGHVDANTQTPVVGGEMFTAVNLADRYRYIIP